MTVVPNTTTSTGPTTASSLPTSESPRATKPTPPTTNSTSIVSIPEPAPNLPPQHKINPTTTTQTSPSNTTGGHKASDDRWLYALLGLLIGIVLTSAGWSARAALRRRSR
jgi:hypothetical protein